MNLKKKIVSVMIATLVIIGLFGVNLSESQAAPKYSHSDVTAKIAEANAISDSIKLVIENGTSMKSVDALYIKLSTSLNEVNKMINTFNTTEKKQFTRLIVDANSTKNRLATDVSIYRSLSKAEVSIGKLDLDKASSDLNNVKVYQKNSKEKKLISSALKSELTKKEQDLSSKLSTEKKKLADLKKNDPNYVAPKRFFALSASDLPYDELEKYENYAQIANDSVFKEFGYLSNVESILKKGFVTINVLEEPNKYADFGRWSLTAKEDGTFEMNFLAKSKHKKVCCTSTGGEFDDMYFKTTMIHELDTVILRGLVSSKSAGWKNLYDAPEWFTQGYQEYLGYTYAGNADGKILIQKAKKDNTISFNSNGVNVKDVYGDGYVLLTFLNEKYGNKNVHKVLLSSQSDFNSALNTEIGTYTQIEKDFKQWLSAQ